MQSVSEYKDLREDSDFIKAKKFVDFFTEKSGVCPHSLFFPQLVNDKSAFRLMLSMTNVFVVTNEEDALFSPRKTDRAKVA